MQRCEAEAREQAQAGRRDRARTALTERDQFQLQLTNVEGVHTNLVAQLGAVETARAHASVAQSMRDGAALMAEAENSLDGDRLHRDLVDMRSNQRRVDHVTRMMTRPMFGQQSSSGDDDNEIDAELERLMQSAASMPQQQPENVGSDSTSTGPVTTTTTPDVRRVEEDMGL
jgi:hypothetical protein